MTALRYVREELLGVTSELGVALRGKQSERPLEAASRRSRVCGRRMWCSGNGAVQKGRAAGGSHGSTRDRKGSLEPGHSGPLHLVTRRLWEPSDALKQVGDQNSSKF